MSSRRDFLRLSALASAAGCTLGPLSKALASPASSSLVYGVQLYMVRRQAPQDLAGVLRAIRQIGYTQIELYPIVYSHPAPELRRIVQDAGLTSASAHFDYAGFESKIDYGHQLGLEYMVCPMLPKNLWTSAEGFREAAAKFNTWGKLVHDAGMTFAFHNHDYEFKPQGNTTGFAELMQHTDPALVKLEFDLYWLTQGGQDPAAMLAKYANRARLVHLKDRKPNSPTSFDMEVTSEHFTEIGKGTVQWPALLSQAHKQGIKYAFVDQDETSEPVLESLKESYSYLRTLKV
jgi:sugar phosphate isomerase/epimerase